jgi:hypothetical protein
MLTTIDALKEYMGDISSLNDVLLTRIVGAASDAINSYCGRTFESTVYTDELYDGSGTDVLVLRNFPAITLTTVKEGGSALTIGTDPYGASSGDVYLNADEGTIVRPFSRFWKYRKYYSITYTAGFTTIPASIVQACLDMSALMVREKDHAGLSSKNSGTNAVTYIRALPDFSQRALDMYQDAAMGRVD